MELKELRYGNIVLEQDGLEEPYKEVIVEYIGRNLAIEYLKPIPLTEEWLLRFGFEKSNELVDYFSKGKYHLFEKESIMFYFYPEFGGIDNKNYKHIKSVHQLQNLYFALNNEELTIK